MKLIKLTLVFATFLFSAEAAHAVGPMAKADIREGQLICQSGHPVKNPADRAARDERRERDGTPANAGAAL